MHFFTHVLLQATYLGSWLFFAGWGLRYQAKAYHWMLRNRIVLQWMPRKHEFIWGIAWTIFSIALIGLLQWVHWTYAVTMIQVAAPIWIMLFMLSILNTEAWQQFDAWSCESVTP